MQCVQYGFTNHLFIKIGEVEFIGAFAYFVVPVSCVRGFPNIIYGDKKGLKIALRQAANAIGNLKDTHLSDFFRRVAYRKGRHSAVSATARKLAVIIWNMVTKKIVYQPPRQYLFLDQKRELGLVNRIKKQIDKFELKPEDLRFATNCISIT